MIRLQHHGFSMFLFSCELDGNFDRRPKQVKRQIRSVYPTPVSLTLGQYTMTSVMTVTSALTSTRTVQGKSSSTRMYFIMSFILFWHPPVEHIHMHTSLCFLFCFKHCHCYLSRKVLQISMNIWPTGHNCHKVHEWQSGGQLSWVSS